MPEEYITGAGKRQRGIILCGLNEKEIRKFVGLLEPLSHAIIVFPAPGSSAIRKRIRGSPRI